MNQEVKAMWLDALRSGEYKQTRNSLCDTQGFCCLGVLSDLYLKENPEAKAKWSTGGNTVGFQYIAKDGEEIWDIEFLPRPVMEWAGLTDDNPDVVFVNEGRQYEIPLSNLNDESGYNFKEIAEILAQNFGGETTGQTQRSLSEQIQEDIIAFAHSQDPPLLDQTTLDSLCEIVAQRFQHYESDD